MRRMGRDEQGHCGPAAPPPGRYRHFKGGFYDVLATARHTETGESVVIYRAADDPESVWVRPLEMFVGLTRRAGRSVPRFERVEDESHSAAA